MYKIYDKITNKPVINNEFFTVNQALEYSKNLIHRNRIFEIRKEDA